MTLLFQTRTGNVCLITGGVLKNYVIRIQVNSNVIRFLYLLNSLRKHENILVISIISRHGGFKCVDDLDEQSNGHIVLREQNTQSMNRCLHWMAPSERHYMTEPSVQLADVNTQTVVPELPVNLPLKSPVNLPDAGNPMSDSQPVRCHVGFIYKCQDVHPVVPEMLPNISRIICADWIYK